MNPRSEGCVAGQTKTSLPMSAGAKTKVKVAVAGEPAAVPAAGATTLSSMRLAITAPEMRSPAIIRRGPNQLR